MEIKGKTALITWWTAGIGFGVAKAFAQNWANLIITYAHNTERANSTKEQLEEYGISVELHKVDSWDTSALNTLTNNIKWTVNILINNSWTTFPSWYENNEWTSMFQHHLLSTVTLSEWFWNQIWEQKWIIINISSCVGWESLSWYKAIRLESYCCMKSAIDTYTRICANKYKGKIRVNWIAPWNTETEWRKWADPDFKQCRIDWILIWRFIYPEEIWKTALHIIDNEWINWHTIYVDGWVVAKGYE